MNSSGVLESRGRGFAAEYEWRMPRLGAGGWACEYDEEEPVNSPLGRMGDGLDRVAVGRYRGDEPLDALDVDVLEGGALGARLKLVKLRLFWSWMDWASMRPSILRALEWSWVVGGAFLVSLRR